MLREGNALFWLKFSERPLAAAVGITGGPEYSWGPPGGSWLVSASSCILESSPFFAVYIKVSSCLFTFLKVFV